MTGSAPPAVSVIVPTYQRREPVVRAVESALSQLFRDFELIVVDDGSTDGTAQALASYTDSLRLLQQPNRGAAAARNSGLGVARGEFVAFLDSDNCWLPEHLALLVDALDQHPGAVLASSLPTSRGKPGEGPASARLRAPLPRLLIGNNVAYLSTVVARRDAVVEAGGFDERLRIAEDADLWVRMATSGRPFVFLPRPTVRRSDRADSLLASRRSGEYADALEAATYAAIARLGEDGDEQIAYWLRGRVHLVHALQLLRKGDHEGARAEFAAGCELLPDLACSTDSILNHLRFNRAADAGLLERGSQALAVARAWPHDASKAGRTARARMLIELVRPPRGNRSVGASDSLRRFMVRTDRGPLRPLWRFAHEGLARWVAAYLRRGDKAMSAYLRGSLGAGEPIYGLSDIDLAFVAADEATRDTERDVKRRWHQLRRRLPSDSAGLIDSPEVYREADVHAWSANTTLTHGSGSASGRLRPATREQGRARHGAERTLLPGLTDDWRLVGGGSDE